MSSRVSYAKKNIIFGYVGNLVILALQFISRTIFIYTLGATYLGVNGLYTNVLSVLSLADLGIGTAMNYSLYKPVVNKDRDTIKSLMQFYRKAYYGISVIILALGLIIIPFLHVIIKNPGSITQSELVLYYLIFLFNTVSSYFVAFKYSLVNAEQKTYIQTNIHTITMFVTSVIQIGYLLLFNSFLGYLLIGAIVGFVQKIFVNIYLNRLYPFLLEKDVKKLSPQDLQPIKRNVQALLFHKIGTISIHQTDNIVVSTFVNVTMVGLISNYNLLITSVTGFINIIFNALISGFGQLIASESVEKQYKMFRVYRFMGFWIYGFATIAFYILLQPFVNLWIGDTMLVSFNVIVLILINYYFLGHRIVIGNFKTAAGIFEDDKYIAIVQAVVNLVISIVLVQIMGLIGVYIGTIVSGLISTFTKPFIVYRRVFNMSGIEYYKDSLIHVSAILLATAMIKVTQLFLPLPTTIFSFAIITVVVAIVPNVLFLILFHRTEEFRYLYDVTIGKFVRRRVNVK